MVISLTKVYGGQSKQLALPGSFLMEESKEDSGAEWISTNVDSVDV